MAESRMTQDMDTCYVCGGRATEMHHIFYGTANRKIADKYGYVVPLCHECHQGSRGVHFNKGLDHALKVMGQQDFIANLGDLSDFRRLFGKSYL